MIMALVRHIAPAYVSFREGKWEPGRFLGMELRGKTLGLVGLGPIGAEVARLGAGIGMRLLAWTRRAAPERAVHGLAFVPIEDVFSQSDVVSLHLSYRPETHGIISRDLLARMKPTAWFVNSARAKLVDNAALAELLAANRIAGAAIDVHEEEPPRGEYPLRALPNVLVTPHIGYNTREASANMLRIAVDTVVTFARGRAPARRQQRVSDGIVARDPELRRNAVLLGTDYALFLIGLSFASQSTILPAFAAHLGASNVVIGAIPALMTLGWFLPPLFAAHHTRRLARKLPFVLRYTWLERAPLPRHGGPRLRGRSLAGARPRRPPRDVARPHRRGRHPHTGVDGRGGAGHSRPDARPLLRRVEQRGRARRASSAASGWPTSSARWRPRRATACASSPRR